MSLKSRIKKLHQNNKQVTLRHYSLVSFDGYSADRAASRFWVGAALFTLFAFLLFVAGSWIYTAQQNGSNPDVIRANTQAQQVRDEQNRKDKQQYIDGCRDAGKAPGDMGEYRADWTCR